MVPMKNDMRETIGRASTPTAMAWWTARPKWNFLPRMGSMKMVRTELPARRAKPPMYASPLMVAEPIVSVSAIVKSGRGWNPRNIAKSGRNLPHRSSVRVRTAAAQGILFVVIDFENFYKPSQLEDFLRGAAQSEQSKSNFQIARKFQSFNQRRHTRAVYVFHTLHVDNNARGFLFFQEIQQHFANLRRVIERNIANNIHNSSCTRLARRDIHIKSGPRRSTQCFARD